MAAGFGALKRTQRKPLCPELSTGEERQTKVCLASQLFLDVNGFILRKMRKRGEGIVCLLTVEPYNQAHALTAPCRIDSGGVTVALRRSGRRGSDF